MHWGYSGFWEALGRLQTVETRHPGTMNINNSQSIDPFYVSTALKPAATHAPWQKILMT
jgi:hypothetical protein